MSALRKNVASQVLTFNLVNATTGAALTGATVTTKVALDGTQSAGGGTVTELGTGQYKYVPTQGETNGTSVGFSFTATNAVPVNLHCFTIGQDPTQTTWQSDVAKWLGTAASTPTVAGVPNVNAKTWNDLATVALPLVPTTAGRTLDVTAANKVNGVVLVDTVTTYTGNTPQTGDNYARLGAPAGASVSADVAAVKAVLPTALTSGGRMKASLEAILDTAFTEGAAGRIAAAYKQFFNIATPAATMDHGILVDTVTTATTASALTTNNDKTGYGLSSAAVQAIWDALTSALTTVGSIGKLLVTDIDATISSRTKPADTQAAVTLVTTTTTLTNDPTGVTTLLSRIPSGLFTGITSLAQWLGLIAGKQTGNSTARTELRATGAGSGTFDETTDSEEALRDNLSTYAGGDTAGTTTLLARLTATRAGYLDNLSAGAVALEASLQGLITTVGAAGAGLTATATAVWAVATRLLTAGTNIVLAKGVGVTGFNDLSAAQVNTEADTALADYDAPTHAELVSEINDVQVDIAALSIPTANQNADALLARDLGSGTNAGSVQERTVRSALRFNRNKFTIAGGVLTVYTEDDTTVAFTAAITQTAGNPVSASDPT